MLLRSESDRANAASRSVRRQQRKIKRAAFRRWQDHQNALRLGGLVYFVADGSGFVKIGCTCNSVRLRIASMQTSNPRKLVLVGAIKTDNVIKLESAIHSEFSERRHEIGEWFRITIDEVVECLARHGGTLNLHG